MKIFDEINGWSADELLCRINLPLAKDGKSHICPLCAHGKGGDGIRPRNSGGITRWKCFGCGKDFSNFDLAAATLGFNVEYETAEAARRLKEEFGLRDDEETFFSSREKKSARQAEKFSATVDEKNPCTNGGLKIRNVSDFDSSAGARENSEASAMSEQKKSAPISEPKNYAKFLKFCRGNVSEFLEKEGGSFRGLTAETFEKYGLGVHNEFGVDVDVKKVPALIIPYDDFHYAARKVIEVEGNKKVTQHGKDAGLYEPLPINGEWLNFIVEGEIDALSIAQVLGRYEMFGCVATGGKGKWEKVVPELEKRFGSASDKPMFVVAFDNEKEAKEDAENFVADLRKAGYPAEIFFFEDRMKGEYTRYSPDGSEEKYTISKIDANDLLQKDERDNGGRLIGKLLSAMSTLEVNLKKQRAAMKAAAEKAKLAERIAEETSEKNVDDGENKTAEKIVEEHVEENRSGITTFSFADYFSAKFFLDVSLTTKYSNRKTGFTNIDERQVFMPGVYLLGALPACRKTTFAWQLINQLADGGENCIYCSLEMSMLELFTKSMTRELFKQKQKGQHVLALSSTDIRRGAGFGIEEVNRLAEKFSQSAINLRVMELSGINVVELIKQLTKIAAESDKPPVVVLDYLQILPTGKETAKAGVDDALLRLKDFQRATNSTLIIVSAFNRENYWEEASFKSFKESGGIEYSSDSIWAMQNYGVDGEGRLDRDKVIAMSKAPVRKVKFSCLKNRNGSAFDCFFRYHAAHDYFEPYEENDEDDRQSFVH